MTDQCSVLCGMLISLCLKLENILEDGGCKHQTMGEGCEMLSSGEQHDHGSHEFRAASYLSPYKTEPINLPSPNSLFPTRAGCEACFTEYSTAMVLGHREIKRKLSWKLSPCWLVLIVSGSAVNEDAEGKKSSPSILSSHPLPH